MMSRLSTPGSNEFPRGMRLPDESYLNATTDNEEQEEGQEQDNSMVMTDSRLIDDSTASTATEGDSFMDNSFLHTISSANKKYVQGRKLVKASGRQQQQQQLLNTKKKNNKKEEGDELIGESYHLVCLCINASLVVISPLTVRGVLVAILRFRELP